MKKVKKEGFWEHQDEKSCLYYYHPKYDPEYKRRTAEVKLLFCL